MTTDKWAKLLPSDRKWAEDDLAAWTRRVGYTDEVKAGESQLKEAFALFDRNDVSPAVKAAAFKAAHQRIANGAYRRTPKAKQPKATGPATAKPEPLVEPSPKVVEPREPEPVATPQGGSEPEPLFDMSFANRKRFRAMMDIGRLASLERDVFAPVRERIEQLKRTDGDPRAASRAQEHLIRAQLAIHSGDGLPYALLWTAAAREAVGIVERGTFARLAVISGYEVDDSAVDDEPEEALSPVAAPSPTGNVVTLAPRVSDEELFQVSLHESMHCCLAIFCDHRVESAVARPDGSGQCIYIRKEHGDEYNEILISLSALRRSQLVGRDPGGIGSDLRQLAIAVSRRTGENVSVDDVLRHDEVYRAGQFLDDLYSHKLSPIVRRIAVELYDASPNEVSGERLAALWDEWKHASRLRGEPFI